MIQDFTKTVNVTCSTNIKLTALFRSQTKIHHPSHATTQLVCNNNGIVATDVTLCAALAKQTAPRRLIRGDARGNPSNLAASAARIAPFP
jgi:hypothetical protein